MANWNDEFDIRKICFVMSRKQSGYHSCMQLMVTGSYGANFSVCFCVKLRHNGLSDVIKE